MTAGALFGAVATFALVLGLMAVALRLLRRFVVDGATSGGRGRLQMEVVQRLAVGPKQGIAVVRIGERVLAVSLGEGGVRPLAELEESELVAATSPEPAAAVRVQGGDFVGLLRGALRNAGVPALLLAASLLALAPGGAQAQSIATPASQQSATQGAASASPAQAGQATASRASAARADTMISRLAPRIDVRVGEQQEGLRLSGTVGVVVMMGLLTLIPTLVLMMTGFTRILIVLHFLRQALGTQSAPPSHLVAGLALLLTGFVMAPTLREVNESALQPWMEGTISQTEMLSTGAGPFREFMVRQTRESDIRAFLDMSNFAEPATIDEVPLVVLTSAFVTSELRTAFQIGFALFLPFIVIDVVVASVLMSMGMFMLPPAMISLPFKLLLFVLVDGWTLLTQSIVASFR